MFEYQRQRENFQSWQKQKITYKGIRIGLIIFFSQKNGCEETIKYSFKTIHEKVIKTRMWHMAKLLIKDLKTFNFILKINMRLLEQRSINSGRAQPFGQTYVSKISSSLTVFLIINSQWPRASAISLLLKLKEDTVSWFLKFPKSLSFTFCSGPL